MAHAQPFQSLRPVPALASQVAELPYDVMNSDEARVLVATRSHSFMRVDRAEVELPPGTSPHAPEVYAKAREVLQRLVSQGALVRESAPSYYAYRLTMNGRPQTGLVACVAVDDYISGAVKRHEFTRADKELDRVTHIEACDAHTGPIMLTFRGTAETLRLLEAVTAGEPLSDFVSADGVGHTVWRIADAVVIEEITSAFQAAGDLYIADGHHRCAAAAEVARKRREADPSYTGLEEYNWFLAVAFPEDELRVMDYNRVVADLAGLDAKEFMHRVEEHFEVRPVGAPGSPGCPYSPPARHTFGMFTDGIWYALTARPGSFDEADPIGCLDVSILQANLLSPVLGIADPRTDKRIDFVGGIRGLAELERRVAEGMSVAFALYPVSVAEMMAVADAGMVMPPKSTWFEPKLRSGLFVHTIS